MVKSKIDDGTLRMLCEGEWEEYRFFAWGAFFFVTLVVFLAIGFSFLLAKASDNPIITNAKSVWLFLVLVFVSIIVGVVMGWVLSDKKKIWVSDPPTCFGGLFP